MSGNMPMDDPAPGTGARAAVSRGYKLYVLAILTSVYFFYLLDRNAILVTQEMFKAEFALSDTQVGLIIGVTYGGAYALVGLPIGRIIDSVNRPRMLGILVAIWSAVTALCGIAGQFWHMAAARAVVGGAESGGAPASLSILSDLFSERRRATVSSIFFAGAGLGGIVSFLAGGYIAAHFGWRAVFLVYGLPGLVLGLLIFFTVHDPVRKNAAGASDMAGLFAACIRLVTQRSLLPIYLGSTLYTLAMSGTGLWLVAFFSRVHGLSVTSAGAAVALIIGVGGMVGSLLAGVIADAAQRRRDGGLLLVIAIAALLNLAFALVAIATASTALSIVAFLGWGVTSVCYSGPANAAISQLSPANEKGLAFALFAVLCNFVGTSLGALLSGALSDAFSATWGTQSIQPAMAIIASAQVFTALAFLWGIRESRRHTATLAGSRSERPQGITREEVGSGS